MKDFTLWNRLGVDSGIIGKSEQLASELEKLNKEGRAKIDKEILAMEQEVWEAAEVDRRAQAVMSADAGAKHRAYINKLEKKNSIFQKHHRQVDGKRIELESLLFSTKGEALDLMDVEIKKVLERKEIKHPLPRGHEYLNRIVDYERIDADSGTVWLRIQTNAPACAEAHTILMLAKGALPNVLTAEDLKFVLEDTDTKLSEIDFSLKDVEIRKDDFEFHDAKMMVEFQTYLRPGDALKSVDKIINGKALTDKWGGGFRRPR